MQNSIASSLLLVHAQQPPLVQPLLAVHDDWGRLLSLGRLKLADPADKLDEGGGVLGHAMVGPHCVVEVLHLQGRSFGLLLLQGVG